MGYLYEAVSLQDAIKNKRDELHEAADQNKSLSHPNVLRISQQLDELIVKAQKEGLH